MFTIWDLIPATLWPLIIIIALGAVVGMSYFIGFLQGKENESILWKRGQKRSRSVLGGLFSEQVAPFLPNFPKELKTSEAKFIGKPIDFIFFKGLDDQNINEVVFVEIKSGKSQLNTNERKLRDAIINKKVSWYEYRVDDAVAKISLEQASGNTVYSKGIS